MVITKEKEKITYYIIDTTFFLRTPYEILLNKVLDHISEKQIALITTPLVIAEIKDRITSIILSAIIDKITVIKPSRKYVNKIKSVAKKLGLLTLLSEADIEITSIGLQFLDKKRKVVIITDDFSIQDICYFLKIPVASITGKKIEFIYKIKKQCSLCGYIFDASKEFCPKCGSSNFKLIKKKIKSIEGIEDFSSLSKQLF
ncbi:MAG: hypothetical protein ACTSVW_00190 [Candidatus Njordarchaeales archaeon]|nr:hypothetical protein [Candidatus Korarchaeota archaeon]